MVDAVLDGIQKSLDMFRVTFDTPVSVSRVDLRLIEQLLDMAECSIKLTEFSLQPEDTSFGSRNLADHGSTFRHLTTVVDHQVIGVSMFVVTSLAQELFCLGVNPRSMRVDSMIFVRRCN